MRGWWWRAFTSRYLIPGRGGLLRPEEAEKRGPWIDFLRCAVFSPPSSSSRLGRSSGASAEPPSLSFSLSHTHTLTHSRSQEEGPQALVSTPTWRKLITHQKNPEAVRL